jgi:hypothetical protein
VKICDVVDKKGLVRRSMKKGKNKYLIMFEKMFGNKN